MEAQGKDRYDLRGVSASKQDVHNAIKIMDKGLYPNAFCKIIPDIVGGHSEFANVMHADTAGTKTILSYLYWRETGDLSVWSDIIQDALVMNLDDMACVGITDNIVISSTIGRNKNLIPGEVLEELMQGSMKFIKKMSDWGINIYHSGGETADVGDVVRTIDVGFTTFARIPRNQIIVNDPQPGDLIIGIGSYGQASYEDSYNSGIGSNGLTMARHELLSRYYCQYPETFDPLIPPDLCYNGSWRLTDKVILDNQEYYIKQLLLSPTRTYLPLLHKLFGEYRSSIHSIIHNSGGGLTKVIKFLKNLKVFKNNLLDIPPVFRLISQGGVPMEQMWKVFNMGQRLELYIDPAKANEVIQTIHTFNIPAQVIGHVERSDRPEVIIQHQGELYTYRS